jgi:transposase-like protein
MDITNLEKESIINEYLLGGTSYRKLAKKHGIDHRTLHGWVRKFEGRTKMKPKQDQIKISKEKEEEEELVPVDVKKLQEELRIARLHNELLNTMIDIAEERLKIDIRKKSGTKR